MITFENDTGRVHPQTPHFEVMEESKDMGSEIDMGFDLPPIQFRTSAPGIPREIQVAKT